MNVTVHSLINYSIYMYVLYSTVMNFLMQVEINQFLHYTFTHTVHLQYVYIFRYHIITGDLGVEYYHNKTVWMTSAVFNTWITNWNHDLRWMKGNHKVLLIIDSASSHVAHDLSNILVKCLLPNASASLWLSECADHLSVITEAD